MTTGARLLLAAYTVGGILALVIIWFRTAKG